MRDNKFKKRFNEKLEELENNPEMIEKIPPMCFLAKSVLPDLFQLKSDPFYFYLMAYSGIEYALAIDVQSLT